VPPPLPTKGGGLDLSRSCLHRELQSWHWQKVSLYSPENLNNLKACLDQDWEISSLSRHHLPVSKVLIQIEKSVETWNFWLILTVCVDLDQESVDFIILLAQDFSICWDFWAWSPSKSLDKVEISQKTSKSLYKSQIILIVSKSLDCLHLFK